MFLGISNVSSIPSFNTKSEHRYHRITSTLTRIQHVYENFFFFILYFLYFLFTYTHLRIWIFSIFAYLFFYRILHFPTQIKLINRCNWMEICIQIFSFLQIWIGRLSFDKVQIWEMLLRFLLNKSEISQKVSPLIFSLVHFFTHQKKMNGCLLLDCLHLRNTLLLILFEHTAD